MKYRGYEPTSCKNRNVFVEQRPFGLQKEQRSHHCFHSKMQGNGMYDQSWLIIVSSRVLMCWSFQWIWHYHSLLGNNQGHSRVRSHRRNCLRYWKFGYPPWQHLQLSDHPLQWQSHGNQSQNNFGRWGQLLWNKMVRFLERKNNGRRV